MVIRNEITFQFSHKKRNENMKNLIKSYEKFIWNVYLKQNLLKKFRFDEDNINVRMNVLHIIKIQTTSHWIAI